MLSKSEQAGPCCGAIGLYVAATVIGSFLFGLIDFAIGYTIPGPELADATETLGLGVLIVGSSVMFGILAGLAMAIIGLLGMVVGKALKRRNQAAFILFLIASAGFVYVNLHTFDGGRISKHAQITMIIAGFRIVGILAIGIGIKVLLILIRKTECSGPKSLAFALFLGFVSVLALWQNVVRFPGLYPMLHTQMVALGAIVMVVGPALYLARRSGLSKIFLVVALGSCLGAAHLRTTDLNISVGSAVASRGQGVQEFFGISSQVFDCWKKAATLTLSEPPAGELPGNEVEAERIANAWFQDQLDPKKKYNVLFLAIDTLRFDHCGFTGYDRNTTPNIDKLAADAFVFDYAYSAYPTSSFSYSSLFTGLYARANPVYSRIKKKGWSFSDDIPFAGLLGKRGWNTIAVNAFNASNAKDDNWFGLLSRGFDIYNPDQRADAAKANQITASAKSQVDKNNGKPFVLWAHYLDPHGNYEKWDGFDFGDDAIDRYDSEIAWTDSQAGELLDHLEKRGDLDHTIVVMFADHGEEFGEHAGWDHNTSLYEEQIRVPLFIRVPGVKGKHIDTTVSLVDVVPTLTALLNVKDPEPRHGRNLLPVMFSGGKGDLGLAYADHFVAVGGKDTNTKRMLIRGREKLIHAVQKRSYEVFDLKADPGEKRNLVAKNRSLFEKLGGLMAAMNDKIDSYHLKAGEKKEDPVTVFKNALAEGIRLLGSKDVREVTKGGKIVNSLLFDYVGNLTSDVLLCLGDGGAQSISEDMIAAYYKASISRGRTQCLDFVARIRHPGSQSFLREIAKKGGREGSLAIAGLAHQGISYRPEILRMGLKTPGTDAPATAVALAHIGDPAALPWLASSLTSPSWKIVGQMIQALPGFKSPHLGHFFRDLLMEGRWRPKPIQYALAEVVGDMKGDANAEWIMYLLAACGDPTVRDHAQISLKKAGVSKEQLDAAREAVRLEWEATLEITNRAFAPAMITIDKALAANSRYNAALRLRKARYLHLLDRRDEAKALLNEIAEKAPLPKDKRLAKRRLEFLPWSARIEDHGKFGLEVTSMTMPKKVWPNRPFMIDIEVKNTGTTAIQGGYWKHASDFMIMWEDEDGKVLPQRLVQDNYIPDGGILPGESLKLSIVGYPASHKRPFAARPIVVFEQPWFRPQGSLVLKGNRNGVIIHRYESTVETTTKGYPKPKKPNKSSKKDTGKVSPVPGVLFEDLPRDAKVGVTHPAPPIFVVEENGEPVVSEAGYLQLADGGRGFYYGALVQERAAWTKKMGILHTNNWGDAETLCFADRIVQRWGERYPKGPRLGIDEISARYGGFMDYDHDGAADHKTHQTGRNINFLMPTSTRPENYIHLGVQNESSFDPAIFAEMIELLVAEGAYRMTTNVATKVVATNNAAGHIKWNEVKRSANGYSITYQLDGGRNRLYLLTNPGDHGDHVNTMLWRAEK